MDLFSQNSTCSTLDNSEIGTFVTQTSDSGKANKNSFHSAYYVTGMVLNDLCALPHLSLK